MAGKQRGAQTNSPPKQLLTVQRLIQKVLSNTMSGMLGSTVQVKASELSFEEFRVMCDKVQTGYLLAVFSSADRACLTLFVPDTVTDALLHGDGDEKRGAAAVRQMAGNLPRICGLREGGSEGPVMSISKPYSAENQDQVFWTSSECSIFQCRTGVHVFYIYCSVEMIKYAEDLLNNDASFLEAVRQKILSPEQAAERKDLPLWTGPVEAEVPLRIAVTKPLEFLLGSCFLPRQSFVGKKNVSALFTDISASPAPEELESGGSVWFRFWVEAGGETFSIYYTVDVKGQTEKYRPFFEKLFKELVRYAAVFLRREIGLTRAGGSMVKAPAPGTVKDALVCNSLINFETNQIDCRVFVPEKFFSGCLAGILEPWEREILKTTENALLPLTLSINYTLFGKNVDSFYRQSSFLTASSDISPLRVSEIFAILSAEDSRRLVQNYFLSSGWSPDKFQALFVYRYYIDEDVKPKIARDVLFDKEEFARFFPPAQRENWRQCKGAADSYEQQVQLNREALEGIFSAINSDRLILPYKAFYMLYNEYQKPTDEHYTKKIDEMKTGNRAAAALPDIQRNRGQQAISSIPTARLALALLPGTPSTAELAKFISKTKRGELEEEIRIQKKKFENGGIPAETVYKEMLSFIELLEELAVPEEEMVE